MAEVQDYRVPYELLVRYGGDGAAVGIQVQYRHIIKLNDAVLRDEIEPAAPLAVGLFPTSDLMTETAAQALADVTTLNAALAAAAQKIDDLQQALEDANARLAEYATTG